MIAALTRLLPLPTPRAPVDQVWSGRKGHTPARPPRVGQPLRGWEDAQACPHAPGGRSGRRGRREEPAERRADCLAIAAAAVYNAGKTSMRIEVQSLTSPSPWSAS